MDYAIIAAGQGSRIGGGNEQLHKPLVEIGGEPMIGRLIRILSETGADSINVITNPAMPDVTDYLKSLTTGPRINVIEKSTAGSMESFHTLAGMLPADRPFCLMTVDSIFDPAEFRSFIKAFDSDPQADGYMAVTTYVADEKPLFVAATDSGDITGFFDHPLPDVRFVSGGIYALRPSALGILDDCAEEGVRRMRDFQRAMVAAGMNLKAWQFSKIIDVDRPEDLAEAETFITDL
ncbi:MAG: NDP-sugar synthase [Bacteroides sp.]|nr:NDP-sugar synthase [Bacteroides sp.]